jgi:AraC-like DNA-binding protein/tetratricopeptide (TPR) repeat protein
MTEPLSADQAFIRKLTDIVLSNLQNENFGVKELAGESGISLYRLSRRLHSITNKTVNQYIREVRLKKALELLQSEDITASEVAYKTGFNSPVYFNKCFHAFYGYPPGKVSKQDSNNYDPGILSQLTDENKTKKTFLRLYILTVPTILILFMLIGMTGFLIYTKVHKSATTDYVISTDGRISIAVMPFRNMTNDTTLDVWQDGLQDLLINSLSNSEELKVKQIESIRTLIQGKGITNYASITPSVAGTISQKLNANIFINGSIKQSDNAIRVDAQLINANTEEVFKSFQIDGKINNILHMIDSLSLMANNYLLISILKRKNIEFQVVTSTNSPEAYKYYIMGKNAYFKLSSQTAINWLNQACAIDTNFTWAMWSLSGAYQDFGFPGEAKKLAVKLYSKKDMMPEREKLWVGYSYAEFFNLPEAIGYLRQLEEYDNQSPLVYIALGWTYFRLQQYDYAIREYKKAFGIYESWGSKSELAYYSTEFGFAYHKAGQYKKEKNLYRKAEKYFPDNYQLIYNRALLSLAEGQTVAADRYIAKYISLNKENSRSEADIATDLAGIYSEVNNLVKAGEYFRQALTLEPENPLRMSNLAYFLIDKNVNLNEGIEIVRKALELNHDDFNCLHTLGWGYFKKGRYREALDTLQRSWNLRMEKARYNYEAFLHLEAAKKVVAKGE